MTPRRLIPLIAGAAAMTLVVGVATARLLPWDAQQTPAQTSAIEIAAVEPEPLVYRSVDLTQPLNAEPNSAVPQPVSLEIFGALPLRPRLSEPMDARMKAASATPFQIAPFQPEPAQAASVQVAALPPDSLSDGSPLARPDQPFASVPLPPARPPELASLSLQAPLPPPRPADLAADAPAQPPQQPAPIVVASLSPEAPVARPPLAEPQPEPPFAANAPFQQGQPAYVRIFKQEGELELWLKRGGKFALYKTYPICKWSGRLGPKLREADYQSPEGFYSVSAKQLRPNSNYHRAFNVGFPNALDKQNGYTGGLIMVHGDCKSVGCYAMTDRGIDEIYGFVAAAIGKGQREVPVHIFPFRMTENAMARETGGGWLSFAAGANTQWAPFWRNLKEGYDLFQQTGEPPTAFACSGKYAFNAGGASCRRIAGW